MPSSLEEIALTPLSPVSRGRSPFSVPFVRVRTWWRRCCSAGLKWLAAWLLLQVVSLLDLWTRQLTDGKEE